MLLFRHLVMQEQQLDDPPECGQFARIISEQKELSHAQVGGSFVDVALCDGLLPKLKEDLCEGGIVLRKSPCFTHFGQH